MHGSRSRRTSRSFLDGGTSQGVVSPGRRSGGLGFSHHGEEVGCVIQQAVSDLPSGMVPGYQKPATRTRGKKPGGKPGQRPSPCATGADRPETRTSIAVLSRLPRPGETCAGFRRRFIEDIPEGITPVVTSILFVATGARGARSSSNRRFPTPCRGLPWQPHGSDDRLDAYALGNSISQIVDVFNYHLQMKLTAAVGEPLATPSRRSFSLVPTNPSGSLEIRCVACRRDLVAGVRQDPLAVGLRQSRPDLLHDRPLAGRTGAAAVFHGRIRGYVGQRFLGRRQRCRLPSPAGLPGSSAARLHTVEHYKKADLIGRSFPKSWGDWWATRSAWDIKSPTCLRKTSNSVGNGLGNA